MKKYWKMIVGVLFLAVLIGGSTILYNKLSKEYKQDNLVGIGTGGSAGTQSDTTESDAIAGAESGAATENETAGSNPAENAAEDTGTADNAGTEAPSQAAPDFTVFNDAQEAVTLSDLQGKPVVINFWASWCGPCKSEMPMFQDMYETYGEDLQFMMVNMTDGSRETVETAKAYIEEAGYTFPVYYDTNLEAVYAYYVTSIPATYFIDAEGNFVAYGLGALDEESFLTGLEMLGIIEVQ